LVALLVSGLTAGHVYAGEDPLQTAMEFRDAVVNGDQATFVNSFDAQGDFQQRAIVAMFSFMQAHGALTEALLASFGEEGVAEFYGGSQGPYSEIASVSEEDLTVETSGNTATVTKDDDPGDPLRMVNRDGDWLIVFPQPEPTTPEELAQAEQMLQGLDAQTQALNNLAQMVDDEGMTPEGLQQQMIEEIQTVTTTTEVVEETYEEEVIEETYEEVTYEEETYEEEYEEYEEDYEEDYDDYDE